MLSTRCITLLFSLLFLTLLSMSAQAAGARVGSRLQEKLSTTPSDVTIPIIIRLAERFDPAVIRSMPKKERRQQLVQKLRATSVGSQKELRKLLQQSGIRKIKDLWHINALAIDADPTLIASITSRPEVASVSLDGLVALPPAQPAAVTVPEWNLAAIGLSDLWTHFPISPGDGMVVATIDSGVDNTHPNLPNWRGMAGDWKDFRPTPSSTPEDVSGHGTAVMGILAGNSVGGDAIGVAPGALWIATNPFAAGNAEYSDLHSSFAWALDPDGDPATDDFPDVVNNSWALDAPDVCIPEFQADIDVLKMAGIGVVFAAGNSGPNLSTSQSPANNTNSVAVGSTDPSREIAWFSSRGPSACAGTVFPELVAPGVGIRTTLSGGGYFSVDGTSFSAPHVAGVMALLMQAYPAESVADIEIAMAASATDLGPVGPDSSYGYGELQAMNAWRYLGGEPILSLHDPSPPANDHHLDFGNVTPETAVVRNLTLRNAGSSALTISAIDFSGLTTEISMEVDLCSGETLISGASCVVSLRFSPVDFSTYLASLTIFSTDPVDPGIAVSLAGTGNTPPPAATLLMPADGAVNLSSPVTFSWAQAADVDGDTISTAFLIDVMRHDFAQSTPIIVTTVETAVSKVLFAGCGLFAVAALVLRRNIRFFVVAVAALLALSCGGGGSGAVIVGDVISYEHPFQLDSGTTYSWKVQSTDARGAVTESPVRSFTTAP
jgi:bacillopeptidase F